MCVDVLWMSMFVGLLDKLIQRCRATSGAETTNAVSEHVAGWRLDNAILHGTSLSIGMGRHRAWWSRLTRHTTLEHRRHSATISRAHLEILPLVRRPELLAFWLSKRITDLTLSGMQAPLSNMSDSVSIYSFSQRKVCLTSCWR